MSNSMFRTAERKQARLRIGLSGTSGSGKTMSALRLAYGICKDWSKVFFIDTENGSGEWYVDWNKKGPDGEMVNIGKYQYVRLEAPFTPEKYIEAIEGAQAEGAQVIIIDSITHEWEGKGGLLEVHANMPGNSFTNWKTITPRHNKFIQAILESKAHTITGVRRKQDYAMEQSDQGKTTVRKLGLKEITREGWEYELLVNFELETNNLATASKDRTSMFKGEPPILLNEKVGEQLINWANSGRSFEEVEKEEKEKVKKNIEETRKQFKELLDMKVKGKKKLEEFHKYLEGKFGYKDSYDELELDVVQELIEILKKK